MVTTRPAPTRWAVWMPAKRRPVMRIEHDHVMWWTFDRKRAEVKAEHSGGYVVDAVVLQGLYAQAIQGKVEVPRAPPIQQ